MSNSLYDAAVGLALGPKFSLVVIHSTETQSLGIVRTQDLITAKGGTITIASLWPDTCLEVGSGWVTEKIMKISSYSVFESTQDHHMKADIKLLDDIRAAIERLEEHLTLTA